MSTTERNFPTDFICGECGRNIHTADEPHWFFDPEMGRWICHDCAFLISVMCSEYYDQLKEYPPGTHTVRGPLKWEASK